MIDIFALHAAATEYLRDYVNREKQNFIRKTAIVKLDPSTIRVTYSYTRANSSDRQKYIESVVISMDELRPYYSDVSPEFVCMIGKIDGNISL